LTRCVAPDSQRPGSLWLHDASLSPLQRFEFILKVCGRFVNREFCKTCDIDLRSKKAAVKCVKEKTYKYEHFIKKPGDVYGFIKKLHLEDEPGEVFIAMALSMRNEIIGYSVISRGTLGSAPVDPRSVFQFLLACNAAAGVMVHNHPGGDPEPSSADKGIAKRLVKCGEMLNVNIIDHIVVGDGAFVSLKERGDI
jgi:DNA repair protein RadC